jgi:hypothetical protein
VASVAAMVQFLWPRANDATIMCLRMIGSKRAGTWLVVVVFAMTMSHASVCSAMCAVGLCPSQSQHSSDHNGYGCDRMPMGHSDSHQSHGGQKSDCSMHHHPGANIVKADSLPQFQLSAASHMAANQSLDSTPIAAFNWKGFSRCALSPPSNLRSSQQRVSVLRI